MNFTYAVLPLFMTPNDESNAGDRARIVFVYSLLIINYYSQKWRCLAYDEYLLSHEARRKLNV